MTIHRIGAIDLIEAYVVAIESTLQSIDIVAKLWLEIEGTNSLVE